VHLVLFNRTITETALPTLERIPRVRIIRRTPASELCQPGKRDRTYFRPACAHVLARACARVETSPTICALLTPSRASPTRAEERRDTEMLSFREVTNVDAPIPTYFATSLVVTRSRLIADRARAMLSSDAVPSAKPEVQLDPPRKNLLALREDFADHARHRDLVKRRRTDRVQRLPRTRAVRSRLRLVGAFRAPGRSGPRSRSRTSGPTVAKRVDATRAVRCAQ